MQCVKAHQSTDGWLPACVALGLPVTGLLHELDVYRFP